jgi:hypothetical protein
MFVTTDGVGLELTFFADLKAGGFSSPSTGRFRSVNFNGFSMYAGNFSSVQFTPLRDGFAGLNATSCSIGGFISAFGAFLGMSVRMSYVSLSGAKTPFLKFFARCENGFSCSRALPASNSFFATVYG